MIATLSDLASNSGLIKNMNAQNITTMALKLDEMPDNCLFKIFESLDLKVLCAINKTTYHLNNITTAYLKYRFKNEMVSIKVEKNKVVLSPIPIPFDALNEITIYGNKKQAFRYALNGTDLNKIIFKDLLPKKCKGSDALAEIIEKPLKNLRAIEFYVNRFDGKIYDDILMKCANLHELTIISNTKRYDLMKRSSNDYENDWYLRLYPKLETIQWDAGYIEKPDGFRILLANNPGIKNLKISQNLFEAIDFIESNELKLNRLSIELNLKYSNNITDICDKLNNLLNNNHYERLYLTIRSQSILTHDDNNNNNIRDLASLEMLESLNFHGQYISAIGQFLNLKELAIDALEDGTELVEKLPLLEKLFIKQGSLQAITPLIRYSVNLVQIAIKKVDNQPLVNFDSINEQRNELNGAKTMTIYLEEWAYLKLFRQMKKYSGFSKLIEIRRVESFISDA